MGYLWGLLSLTRNTPLRNEPVVINNVVGALEIQDVFEHAEWVSETGDAAAYAPYLRKSPLSGVPPKSILAQTCKGDETGPTLGIRRSSAQAIWRIAIHSSGTTWPIWKIFCAQGPTFVSDQIRLTGNCW